MQHIYNTNLIQNISNYANFFDKYDKKIIDTLVGIQWNFEGNFLSFHFKNYLMDIMDIYLGAYPKNHNLLLASTIAHTFWFGKNYANIDIPQKKP